VQRLRDCAMYNRQLTPSLYNTLVEIFATTSWFTQTRHLDFLDRKLIVISQFFATTYVSQSKNDNVHPAIYDDLSRVAVWITRVIDKPCNITTLRCIDNVVITTAEHVAANAMRIVPPLSHVGHWGTNHLAGILHQHLTSTDAPETKQPKAVNCWPMHCHCLSAELSQVTKPHCHRQITQFHSSEKQISLAILTTHLHIKTVVVAAAASTTTTTTTCHNFSLDCVPKKESLSKITTGFYMLVRKCKATYHRIIRKVTNKESSYINVLCFTIFINTSFFISASFNWTVSFAWKTALS